MAARPDLFDWHALGPRRDRAMRLDFAGSADFLWERAAESFAERLGDVTRAFPATAILGTGAGAVARALPASVGRERLVLADPSSAMLAAGAAAGLESDTHVLSGETLPLEEDRLDLAISAFLLHWSNDPVGHLVQLRRALRPDGLMLACLFGGATLAGLREAFAEAEAEVLGGITPRVAPMGEIRDLGGLVGRAGFAMPVADAETVRVSYPDPLALMRDLRAMGETNLLAGRQRGLTRRAVMLGAAERYAARHGGPDGVEAVFEILFLTGWAPATDQPVPKRPGSATARLADALGVPERPAGEKAPPQADE